MPLGPGGRSTGKELAARSLHHASRRARRPFVVFDCAPVPSNLAERKLFGHARGAFGEREGAFERAHQGTLFIDEMGSSPARFNPRCCARQVRRVGATRTLTSPSAATRGT
ncbi:MAG: sigma 54-interacting transcriptional regulator [Myxococcota bacterium]